MNFNSETLINAVQTVVLNFEEVQSSIKKVSVQDIADKANSSYTTIREIKKGLLKNLSIKKALEISSKLNGPSTLEELIKTSKGFSPEETKDFTNRFSHLFNYNIMPESFDDLIADKDFSKIIWAAFSNAHITRDEIVYRWGKDGEDRLEFLLEKGLVENDDGIIKGIAEKACAGIESAYKQLGIGYSLYNLNHSKKERELGKFSDQ